MLPCVDTNIRVLPLEKKDSLIKRKKNQMKESRLELHGLSLGTLDDMCLHTQTLPQREKEDDIRTM